MSLPALLVAALLAGLAMGGVGGWQVQAWRWRAADAERLELEREARRGQEIRAHQAAQRHEQAREAIRAQQRVITREVERVVVVEAAAAAAVCIGPDGLRLLAEATGAGADPAQLAAAVPASAPAR